MKRILSIESFREVTLTTWDEHLDGAERVSFSSPTLAEQHLRRFAEEPIALAALRELTGIEPSPSLGGDGVDAILRSAGQRLFDKRLKLYERALTEYFSDVPIDRKSTRLTPVTQ